MKNRAVRSRDERGVAGVEFACLWAAFAFVGFLLMALGVVHVPFFEFDPEPKFARICAILFGAFMVISGIGVVRLRRGTQDDSRT